MTSCFDRVFISRLKDKGEKIRSFKQMLEGVIKEKRAVQETESLLAKLNLGEKIILPKHPMVSSFHWCCFTASIRIKLLIKFNQFTSTKTNVASGEHTKNNESGVNIVKQLMEEELDIYSIAISKTFDEQLSKQRSERFVPNRPVKSNLKVEKEDADRQKVNKTAEQPQPSSSEVNVECSASADTKTEKRSRNRMDKYKGTALECLPNPAKFNQLSVDDSLQLGQEQKYKDFELERLKFVKRLSWRHVTHFDSESEVSEPDTESDNDSDA